jgi:hypothetical protein
MSFSTKAIKYFLNLITPARLPGGTEVINPYKLPEAQIAVRSFYNKYYNDDLKRIYMIGINPGRFGGGLTGIAFTDPAALREHCGIENNLGERKELSSKFIYEMIDVFGGVEKFFSKVFMTALFPLALTHNGKNFNYYDDKRVFELLRPEIIKSVRSQLKFGARKDKVIILGKRNAVCFEPVNKEHGFFKEIIVLDHPRFIMQYRKRHLNKHISTYIKTLS